eukprot:568604_1
MRWQDSSAGSDSRRMEIATDHDRLSTTGLFKTLGVFFDEIDSDQDGFVSLNEISSFLEQDLGSSLPLVAAHFSDHTKISLMELVEVGSSIDEKRKSSASLTSVNSKSRDYVTWPSPSASGR